MPSTVPEEAVMGEDQEEQGSKVAVDQNLVGRVSQRGAIIGHRRQIIFLQNLTKPQGRLVRCDS
jgi:hypothetical protein